MPIAATPAYLGQDFSTASPGMRFGMYLPIWTARSDQEHEVNERARKKSHEAREIQEVLRAAGMDATITALQQRANSKFPQLWAKNDFGAQAAWKKILLLTANDQATMQALVERQGQLASGTPGLLVLDAVATAPFTTGLGNEHPLENGFAFLNPYGLPYLPGSSIKGVLRQAARELASGEWGDTHGWQLEGGYTLPLKGKPALSLSMIDVLFGRETEDGDSQHVRGAISFWDAIPQLKGGQLAVDIMTPHQTHYYQPNAGGRKPGSTSPHDSGQPTPISFLSLPPGTGFCFHAQCDLAHLQRLAPSLAENDQWRKLLRAAFEHAFEWLGFGAKTAVGYGAMQLDKSAQGKREAAQAQAAQQARMAQLSEALQHIETFVQEFRAKHEQFPSFKDKPNAAFHGKARALAKLAHESEGWSADEKRQAAEAIEEWLPKLVSVNIKDERKKLKLGSLKGQ